MEVSFLIKNCAGLALAKAKKGFNLENKGENTMKMNKSILIYSLLAGTMGLGIFFGHQSQIFATVNIIKSIDSFTQATEVLNSATSNSLVLFDVREVLYVPSSAVFHVKVIEDNEAWLKELMQSIFKDARRHEGHYWSIWKRQEIPRLVEPSIVQTIADLQNRNVKVMVLTSLMSGSDFTIASLPEWRYATLKKLGLDFTKAGFSDMVFSELPAKKEQHPILYRGILIASGSPKGQVLGAFLDRAALKPDKVIFFDDSMERVESVAQEMKKRNIPFYGFHYNGARFVHGELDKEVATMQMKHLVEHEEWLSEDQARKLLAQ